jgi:hypothetical protein
MQIVSLTEYFVLLKERLVFVNVHKIGHITTKGSVNDRNTSYKEKTEGNVIAVQCVVEALHVTYSVQHVMLPSV